MAAIGVGVMWFAYWFGLGGVSLVKGWNNNVLQMANPLSSAQFTRACYTGAGIWPTGDPGDSGTCGGGSGGGGSNSSPNPAGTSKVAKATKANSPTGTTNPK